MNGRQVILIGILLNFLFCGKVYAQFNHDTLFVAGSKYVLFHPDSPLKGNNVRIMNDSVLVVYDSTGANADLKILSWTFAVVVNGNYVDHRIGSGIIPESVMAKLRAQPTGAWICIERIAAIGKNGEEIRLNGEKWVKL